ncbi:tyrosine-type recombinase/integrase [Nonomuraea sp. NPDC050540]|uniref:tyrosine-type recombinase/integrase n=1 Tax=Nonomuraea sp. NPDC050540 TaxID=3364367 RepID=UPI0037B075AF
MAKARQRGVQCPRLPVDGDHGSWYFAMQVHRLEGKEGASGLPPIRLHDLRYGAATLALAAHTDLKVVQAMLGHASIVLTADTYVSVLPVVAHEAARETARLVLSAASVLGRELSV